MSVAPDADASANTDVDVDVLVIGAGLSGIGAACHLQDRCPERSFLILEGRSRPGGTWDLFRYPGVRSDSDMHTLGYAFRPWKERRAIADGPAILRYLQETIEERDLAPHMRFRTRVRAAHWSSTQARWTVTFEPHGHEDARQVGNDGGNGPPCTLTCRFLYVCAGYYSYERGHLPRFPDLERFRGERVHPQFWPEDLDCSERRVVVIGSGATAVTLVPELARTASHVILLQRTPTWMGSRPREDGIANALRRHLPERLAYGLVRWKNVLGGALFHALTRHRPVWARRLLLRGVRDALGPAADDATIERDFTPPYDPWDQRLCLVADGDLFEALRDGRASVVTDRIERFTERGIRLASGRELEADVIVTATGLELKALGGIALTVDGRPVAVPDTLGWKGLMLVDVPNLALTFGYTNASWTLRADLVAEHVCRLLRYMGRHGYTRVCARLTDPRVEPRPWIELDSGYVRRGSPRFPRQGSRGPWRHAQSYLRDLLLLRFAPLRHRALEFSAPDRTDPAPVPARS